MQHLRQQWQVLNALGAVGMRQASPTFVARYTTIEASLLGAHDSIAANIHTADPVTLQAANNSAVVRSPSACAVRCVSHVALGAPRRRGSGAASTAAC